MIDVENMCLSPFRYVYDIYSELKLPCYSTRQFDQFLIEYNTDFGGEFDKCPFSQKIIKYIKVDLKHILDLI